MRILIILQLVCMLLLTGCSTTKQNSRFNNEVTAHQVKDLDEIEEVSFTNKMKANYNQVYYYAFDSSELSQEDMQSILVQAEYLKNHPGSKVLIAGHTDSRGSSEYNIALGHRRANSVVTILTANGVANSQIKSISFGEEKPAVLGDSEAAYKWNRRTELKFEDF